ncbi:MAG: HAMP domain-containing histidine kinase [Deltaproteobacteria bacterium]|nr:HAMP domain-containing histidine kinase [Deltaproteobacteria bacterium]
MSNKITKTPLSENNANNAQFTEAQAKEQISQFVSHISHDLRTPLSIIQTALSLVLDEMIGTITAEQRDILTTAMDSSKWLSEMIRSLSIMSKLECGKLPLSKTNVDICSLVEETVSECKPLAEKRSLSLECELPADNIDVCLDPEQTKLVLTNLISNSIKFTPEGGRISVTCLRKDEEVQFSVQDSGVGIAKEDMVKLFEKFAKFSKKPGSEVKGAGLGLAIAKKLVDMHDGRINVESEIDKGATFTISLPLTSIIEVENMPEEMDEVVETVQGN